MDIQFIKREDVTGIDLEILDMMDTAKSASTKLTREQADDGFAKLMGETIAKRLDREQGGVMDACEICHGRRALINRNGDGLAPLEPSESSVVTATPVPGTNAYVAKVGEVSPCPSCETQA